MINQEDSCSLMTLASSHINNFKLACMYSEIPRMGGTIWEMDNSDTQLKFVCRISYLMPASQSIAFYVY